MFIYLITVNKVLLAKDHGRVCAAVCGCVDVGLKELRHSTKKNSFHVSGCFAAERLVSEI